MPPDRHSPLSELFNTGAPVFWDIETHSRRDLKDCGAFVYAADASTNVAFVCFAVGDGSVETWRPGEPVPSVFAAPAGRLFVSDNWSFENAILKHILIPRYGFAPIPIESQDCAQRKALASAFPPELGLRCLALGLPYEKDPAARKAMLRVSRMHEYKDPAARERDLDLLHQRCATDVGATRACYNHPRLRPLSPAERHLLLLDAAINERGVRANVPFLKAGRALATRERAAIDARLDVLTSGAVTSVDQVERIVEAVNARGHAMATLGKRSVAAVLAHQADAFVRELLQLRQRGAFASTRKNKKLIDFADSADYRVRGSLRIYGAGPGRWSALGAQLHNLPRNDAELPSALVDAVITGDHAELARHGNPLQVVGQLSRAALCAAPGGELVCVDFSAIESRITAWLAGETWKLDNFQRFDATGDKALDHYRILAHLILKKNTPVSDVAAAERQIGKFAELAFGFGGSVGAWRRIVGDDGRSDAEIKAIVQAWRSKHPATGAFWRRLMRAALVAIRTKRSVEANPAPLPPITVAFDGIDMTITLPSKRPITYPGAHAVPSKKFEDGGDDIEFMDNAKGQWKPARAWFGTLVENVVQGTARDLLAAAIVRAEARWPGSVVFHCHDELVIEAPIGAIPKQEMLALMLEPPAWAVGLPLGGKVRSGALYLEAPIDRETETAVPHAQSPDPGGDVVVGDVVVVGKVVDPVRHGGDPGRHFADHANVGDSGGNVRDVGDVGDGGNPARHFTDHADLGDSDGDLGNSAHDPHICIYCKLDPPDGTERAVAVAGAWLHPRCEDAFIRARMAEEGIPMGAQSQSPSPPPQSPPPSGESTFSVGNGGSGFGALGDGFGDIARGGNGRARDDYPHGERETGRKVAEHIYPDLKSKPYLKVAKYVLANGKKSFPQYHLENGQWVKGKPEGPAIPYRLPELLAAPPNATVEICEGEKDADNLAALGLIPTTNPGGAGKWTPDMNKWLTGFARANIYEDNDEAGRKHAAKVARELTGVVSDIRIITFRELPEHGDVSDWLKTGKTRADLLARAEEAPKFAALESVCAADEDIAALDWVWPGHFALKKIGLITGLPNEGKGVLLSDIMAHITTGAAWPCNGGSALLGNVILLTAEDDINDTIVPRLMAAGADRERVHIVKMMREADKERMFNLVTDLPVLRQKATEIGDVKAIIIDPVAAYLGIGKVDSFRATDVRAVLGPLKLFAEEATTLILGVMHFNKKTDVTNVMLRVSDSLAYTAAARHVYAVIDDEENGRKLFVKGKNNLAPPGQKTLAFSIAEREVGTDKRTGNPVHAPHIVWHPDPVDITATEALRAASENKSPSARDNAKQLLEMLLSSGPAGSKDVKEAAKENGISWGTVRRAAEVLGVDIKKDGPLNDKGEITWRWHLPVPPHEKHTEGAHRGRGEHLRSE